MPKQYNTELIKRLLGEVPTDAKGTPLVEIKTVEQHQGGYCFKIHQICVACCRENGIVPKKRVYGITDDTTYSVYPDLIKLVPRCFSVVELVSPTGKRHTYRLTGLPKFGGTLTIDDDDQADSTQLDTDSLTPSQPTCDKVVVTEKSNGKSVGFRVIQIDGEYWLYGGSKNRHRLVRYLHFQTDIANLEEVDEQLVVPILQSCYRQLENLTEKERQVLFQKLSNLKEPYTLCGEYNDGKHIVPLPMGQIPEVEWFALQHCGSDYRHNQGLVTDICRNLTWLKNLHLPTIKYHTLTLEQFQQYQHQAREGRNSEGYVYHFIRSSTTDGIQQTVSIVKHKLTWYILIRVVRQIIKNAKTPERLRAIYRHKLKKTLLQRNSFLNLPIPMLGVWYQLLCGFVEWMLDEGHEPSQVGFDTHHRGMGNLWRDFVTDNPDFTDDFLRPEEEIKKRGLQDLTESQAFPQAEKLVVIVQGIPGLGKTTVGNLASDQLGEESVTLEQDTYWQYKTRAKAKCLEQMELYLADPRLSYVWILRNNSQVNQYRDFVRLARDYGWKVLVLVPRELAYPNAAREILLRVCRDTVTTRTGHISFDSLPTEKRIAIVNSFNKTFRPATISESQADSISTINWLRSDYYTTSVTDQNDYRLPIDQIVSQMVTKAQHFRLEKPEPLYIAVKLPEQIKTALSEIIHTEVDELSLEGKQIYLDHLTLAHSEQMIGNEELWESLKQRVGTKLQILVSSLVVVETELGQPESVVVVAHPVDPVGGADLSGLVLSGAPHITAVLPKGVRPKHSLDILQGKQASRIVPLEMAPFQGVVVAV